MTEHSDQVPEWFRAGFKQLLDELASTPLADARGDPDAYLAAKLLCGALVVLQAEAAVSGEQEKELHEILAPTDDDLTEMFSVMSEDDKNTIRRLAHMDGDEEGTP